MLRPHVMVVPYPAQGHVIPLMELSELLAKHGCRVTFVNTEWNHKLVMDALSTKQDISEHISLVSIPDGIESTDRDKPWKLSEAMLKVVPMNVEKLIDQLNESGNDRISCILADQSIGWALEIADKKGIKRAAFSPAAAANLVLCFRISKLINDGIINKDGTPLTKQIIKLSPTMPAINTEHFVWASLGNVNSQKNIFQLMINNNKAMKLTDWLLCNSAYDLEPAAYALAPEILPIGPLLESARLGESAGNFLPEDVKCLDWLDQQQPNSVIYVAFGSLAIFNPIQLRELALGLELLNRPFLWAVRPDFTDEKEEEFLQGLRKRVGNRGQMVSWAPQQKVLQHKSIACFVSHCGWNSTIEGVSNGVPFLCWPYFADQFLNQSYICDVWKIGLGLCRDERGIISHSEFGIKVKQLLDNGEYKALVLDLQERVMTNIKEGGSSHRNLINFIEWIKS